MSDTPHLPAAPQGASLPVRAAQAARHDGWTRERQRKFLEVLADTGSITFACGEVGMSPSSAYRLRRSAGAEGFSAAWSAALDQASLRLMDIAFDRAINGSDEPVFDRDGRRVGRRMRYNDRLLMFLLRAHRPDRYRHAHQNWRHAGEAPPPPHAPLDAALAAVDPTVPPPHRLAERSGGFGVDPDPQLLPDVEEPDPMPLGEDFERALERAKAAAAGTSPVEYATRTRSTGTARRNRGRGRGRIGVPPPARRKTRSGVNFVNLASSRGGPARDTPRARH